MKPAKLAAATTGAKLRSATIFAAGAQGAWVQSHLPEQFMIYGMALAFAMMAAGVVAAIKDTFSG